MVIIVMLLSDVKILSIELVAVCKHHHKMNIGFFLKIQDFWFKIWKLLWIWLMYNFNFSFFAFESKMFIMFEHYVFGQFDTMIFAFCVLLVFWFFIIFSLRENGVICKWPCNWVFELQWPFAIHCTSAYFYKCEWYGTNHMSCNRCNYQMWNGIHMQLVQFSYNYVKTTTMQL
jgi:hypothetical protein